MKHKRIVCLISMAAVVLLLSMPVFAAEVTVNGQVMEISENFDESLIPSGFFLTDLKFQDTTYKGIANAADTTYLFYLTSAVDPSLNGFYVYEGNGKFAEGTVVTIAGQSLTIETPGADEPVPIGYTQNIAKIGGMNATVYIRNEDDGTGNYLVYGTLDGQAHSWFLYNPEMQTCAPTVVDNNTATRISELENKVDEYEKDLKSLNKKYNNDVGRTRNLFLIMVVITTFFFFMMLNAMIKRRHTRLDLEDRIIDLRRNGGRDTMQLSKREKKRQDKSDAKALARNNLTESDLLKEDRYPKAAEPRRKKSTQRATDGPRPKGTYTRPQPAKPSSERPRRASKPAEYYESMDDLFPDEKREARRTSKSRQMSVQEKRVQKIRDLQEMADAEEAAAASAAAADNIDLESLGKNLEEMSNNVASQADVKKAAEAAKARPKSSGPSNPVGGITGSMDFGDDLDIRTIDLDDE